MIWFCVGTTAELIKLYPVVERARELDEPWFMISTGQSGRAFWAQYDDFVLPRQRVGALVHTEEDLESSSQAARWFLRAWWVRRAELVRRLTALAGAAPDPRRDAWVVHGDTLSTIVGAHWARRLSMLLLHLEAGLSSGRVSEPFPEELSRRWVSRRADVLLAPDEWAADNLRRWGCRGRVRLTGGNTLKDAVQRCLARPAPDDVPKPPYALANVHRFENLSSAARLETIVGILEETARRLPLYMVQHAQTVEALARRPALRGRLEASGVHLIGRMPFTRFVHWLAGAELLVSDGGSNQEECSYLGLPCLILRRSTERRDGLGESCVLNGLDLEGARAFLDEPQRYRRARSAPTQSPSEIVVAEAASA